MRNPKEFYRFYRNKMLVLDAKPQCGPPETGPVGEGGAPQSCHYPEHRRLHQKAGSKEVLELHGSIHRNYCTRCGKFFDAEYMQRAEGVPKCECGGIIKPDVVLYEEGLDMQVVSKAIQYISRADVLIVGGTSLVVYPAAGLIDYYNGKKLVMVNKSVTPKDAGADLLVQGSIGEIFSQI